MQHALLIVNPHSRNGQAKELEVAIELLRASGIELTVYISESESQMLAKIADYQQQNGIVIIAGGDGTISSALHSIYSNQRTLAILPLGTANDLARSLGVPQELAGAAQVIINAKRERINLAKVNDKLFINVAHIGLGVDVTHELTPDKKKYFGVFAYLGALFRAIKRNRSFSVNIETEGWSYSAKAIHLAVGSSRYYGGGNIVDNESTLLDEQLNLFCIKAQPWWQLLLLGPSLRTGKLKKAERVVCRTAKEFRIRTSKPIHVEADGEFKTKTPATLVVLPQAIEVIAGDIPMPNTNKV
ncbi:MAG: diacylglycerol kinase [Rheinheimera sp.]|uniref:lipid kinase n=1 Tax=Arsukibacterium sp. UBA3155 TaxID=1946058 RepID=UPI000C9254AB|nr:lipid kinase [Arsukibacterium sp. UBA3155]MAD76395.1 diacylglycerol kinase [Rheinheimera sp.]